MQENVAVDVAFEFTSAIRYDPQYLVDSHIANDTMYRCPDEGFACTGTTMDGDNVTNYDSSCGCPYTAWVECAMNKTVVQNQKVNFITCWDDASIADKLQNETTLSAITEYCSLEASIDFSEVLACHSGDQKSDLLWQAANKFMTKWPNNTVMGGPFHVPHILLGTIDGKDVEDTEEPKYNASDIPYFNNKLCALGIKMPACDLASAIEV